MLSHQYTSEARSSPLPSRDVRDELELSPARGAHPLFLHPSGGLPGPAPRSPPTPHLLCRAGPVNRGAVWGRVQLDGRRLLLGHFEPGKGASNSERKAVPLASSLGNVPRPSRGTNWGRELAAVFGGRGRRAVQSARTGRWRSGGTPALLARGSARRAENERASQQAQFRSPRFPPPSLPQSTGPSGSSGSAARVPETCSNQSPKKCSRRRPSQ